MIIKVLEINNIYKGVFMKKVILTILLSLVLFMGLVGCEIKNEFDIGSESNIEISTTNDVTLSIKEGTLTNQSATIVLTNNTSDKDFQYGNPYEIEIKKDGEWHKINVELNFTLPGFTLKPGESKEINLNWKHDYGKLASGTYRIIKSVDIEMEDEKFESLNLAVEFNIDSD